MPDHEPSGIESFRIDRQGGAALPQGHQAPRMDEHGGIRNVHVVGSH